ncbi:MAG TPA: cytochrome c peroxidase [Polyangiaceae bacterium]|nr:cytochrome c peroxidase [Polyangiaceae bacterium]
MRGADHALAPKHGIFPAALACALASACLFGCSSGAKDQSSSAPTAAERTALSTLSAPTLPPPGPDASNRFADDMSAAALGQRFFFETAFSGKLLDGDDDGSASTLGMQGQTGKVACAGCHVPSAGFLDNRTLGEQISLAAGWGRRRTPSLLNVGQAKLLMWDGRHDALYNQPFGPLESPVEMNSSRLFAAEQIFALHRADYEAVFGPMPPLDDATRFPPLDATVTGCQPSTVDPVPTCNGTEHGMPGDHAEFDGMSAADQDAVSGVIVNLGKALGAYERLLACGPSRFDRWVAGDDSALSASEQRGAALFVGRGQCSTCHSGPYLSDQQFHDVGLEPTTVAVAFTDQDDQGAATGLAAAIADPLNTRGKFSDGDDQRLPEAVDPSLTGAFRTPSLRCEARRPSFMHTGQLKTLADVVSFFTQGGDAFGYPGTNELTPLDLSAQDQADLVAFLGTLEGPGPDASLLSAP